MSFSSIIIICILMSFNVFSGDCLFSLLPVSYVFYVLLFQRLFLWPISMQSALELLEERALYKCLISIILQVLYFDFQFLTCCLLFEGFMLFQKILTHLQILYLSAKCCVLMKFFRIQMVNCTCNLYITPWYLISQERHTLFFACWNVIISKQLKSSS